MRFSMNPLRIMWYRRALATLALLLLAGSSALAGIPSAPSEVYAGWSAVRGGDRTLEVVWIGDNHDRRNAADGYNVYQSFNSSEFSKVATVEADPHDKWGGYVQLPATNPGMYTYYVTAYNKDGESQRSMEASVELPSAWIQFADESIWEKINAGETYTHTFSATASNGENVRYTLIPAIDIDGNEVPASLDPETGEFSVTLEEDGQYTFTIIASLESDSTVFAATMLGLQVGDGGCKPVPELCAVIKGTVTDQNGNPIDRAMVSAIPDGDEGSFMSFASPVINGVYEIPVAEGSYRLVVERYSGAGPGLHDYIFYPNTQNYGEATVFDITCDQTEEANFVLESREVKTITVSGRVTRASDGSGVIAMVTFYANDVWMCSTETAMTDENGNYEIQLPASYGNTSFSYIAQANPLEFGLFYQFFDGVDNPMEATAISESRSDVNFVLSGLPVFDNSISGSVRDEQGNPVEATVVAVPVMDENHGPSFPFIGVVETINGEYTLQNLQPADYILVVMPYDEKVAPGYFTGVGQVVSFDWEQAVMLTIEEKTNLPGTDMVVRSIDAEGINVVDGVVSKSGTVTGGGNEPLAGVMVYAMNQNGAIVGSTVSDAQGRYSVSGLGVGEFRLYADRVGFMPSESVISFDKSGTKQSRDVTLAARQATDVKDPILDNASFTTYPNPVTSLLTVRFNALPGTVRLTLNDVTGTQMMSRDIQTTQGENSVQLDLTSFASGVYMVSLKSENSVMTTPVTIVR
jgi:hypothetical protein